MARILPANTPVTKRETAFYGIFGGGGFLFSYMLFSSVILYYFTDVLGIGAAAAGVLLLIARVWDGVNDPLMGILIDKTRSPWGKNRPYILAGGILMAIFTVLLFTNPNLESQGAKLAWAYFTYIGYGMSYTMCTIAISSLPSRLTTNRHEVTKLSSAFFAGSGVMSVFASLTLMSFIALFGGSSGDTAAGYRGTAVMAAAIVLVFTLILALTVRERNLEGEAVKKIRLLEAIKTMLTNVHYVGFIIAEGIFCFGYYLSASTVLYYCIYNLGSQSYYTPLLFCDYAMPLVAAVAIPYLARKFDKKGIVVASMAVTCAAYLLRFLTGDANTFIMVLLAAAGGIAASLFNVLFTPVSLDCAIYSEHKTGLQLQGSFVAANSILAKAASGLSAAFLAAVLTKIGYVEGAAEQTAEVLFGLKLCATLSLAIACLLSAVIFAVMYRLKSADLEAMNQENIQKRNLTGE